jgi:uncharacterized secreted protein with C-terminal beta-propeller domain
MARYFTYGMTGVGIAAAVGFVLILGSIGSTLLPRPAPTDDTTTVTLLTASSQELAKFSSVQELQTYLSNVESTRNAFLTAQTGVPESFLAFDRTSSIGPNMILTDADLEASEGGAEPAPSATSPDAAKVDDGSAGYSTTNVQVEGVDEPDFVKNDGRYAYILSGDKLTIAEVYPTEDAKVVAKVGLDIGEGQFLQNMFLSNNTLVVFYQEYGQDYAIPQYEFAPQPVYSPKTHAVVLDITDRAQPEKVHDYVASGAYSDARMIGQRVYLITTSDLYSYSHPIIPKIMESSSTVVVPDIYYFRNPEPYYSFNTVTSLDVAGEDDVQSKTFMMNPASTLYVSESNIYIAYQKYQPWGYYEESSRDRFFEAVVPLLPSDAQDRIRAIDADDSIPAYDKWDRIATVLEETYNAMSESDKTQLFEDIQEALAEYDAQAQKDSMKTVIHRISIGSGGEIEYGARGEVPGRLLNQFSMDESGERFRVATTVEYYTAYAQGLYNNVYVLNMDMETVGSLENIEEGESIYATRFIGDRLYMVTFQRIDPLFVIDLSSDDPQVLGELKLPGYSTYLHPYDEDHIIGIGKDAKDNEWGGVSATGVKVALFDVSDVSNPELVDEYLVEGEGTDSEALYDHKAFLFSRESNVLSIPISTYDVESQYAPDGRYIEPKVWRGFYVFSMTPEDGIDLKGTVEHANDAGYYYYYGVQGSRSFYIGDVLYTLSGGTLKMSDIDTLDALGELEVRSTGEVVPYPLPVDAME